jgi:hypothetical protein
MGAHVNSLKHEFFSIVFKCLAPAPQETHFVYITKTIRLILLVLRTVRKTLKYTVRVKSRVFLMSKRVVHVVRTMP